MTTTANKGYTQPIVGADFGVWGNELNGNLSILDKNLGGDVNLNVAGSSDYTVSTTDAQNLILFLSGALTGNIRLLLPALGGQYIIQNSTTGAFTVTVYTVNLGNGVALPRGYSQQVWTEGVNVIASAPPAAMGRSWHDVSGSRVASVLYTNTIGTEIEVAVSIAMSAANLILQFQINGANILEGVAGNASGYVTMTLTVPVGATYELIPNSGTATVVTWQELY